MCEELGVWTRDAKHDVVCKGGGLHCIWDLRPSTVLVLVEGHQCGSHLLRAADHRAPPRLRRIFWSQFRHELIDWITSHVTKRELLSPDNLDVAMTATSTYSSSFCSSSARHPESVNLPSKLYSEWHVDLLSCSFACYSEALATRRRPLSSSLRPYDVADAFACAEEAIVSPRRPTFVRHHRYSWCVVRTG